MKLKITPALFSEVLGFNSRQLLSSLLAGTVIVGTSSFLLSNNNISFKLKESIKPALEQLALTSLGKGLNAIGSTIKSWGSTVIATKDDFAEWAKLFLNIDGFKSGAAELYQKLVEWAKIVYDWFANKFLKFISNIPEMVKNWKKLRLSLFKWGTFLGGGGGQALWAMFGSGANWDKLGELMNHPNFEEMMGDFNKLVQENPDAFEELGAEGIEEIIEEYLNDPDSAKEAAKELIKEQEEKKKAAEEGEKKEESEESDEQEKKPEEQLTAQEIKDKFKPSKTGKPQNIEAVLGNMAAWGLGPIFDLPRSSLDGFNVGKATELAKSKMTEYIKLLEEEAKKEKKGPKKEFIEKINEEERKTLIDHFTKLAISTYEKYPRTNFEDFSKHFSEEVQNSVTDQCTGDDCNATGLSEKLKVGPKPKKE